MATIDNTYVILTNPAEVSLYNAINQMKKLNSSYLSNNGLYAYYAIASILADENTADKEQLLSNLNNISFQKPENEIFWDDNYNYDDINSFINDELLTLFDDDTAFDNLNKTKFSTLCQKINDQISDNYNKNGEIFSKADKLNNEIESIFNKYPNLKNKVNNQFNKTYAELQEEAKTKVYTEKDYNLDNKIIDIINNVNSKDESSTESKTYYIIVGGNKLPIENRITKKVNEINSLYEQLIDTTNLNAEIIYALIIKDFINRYDQSEFKVDLLSEYYNSPEDFNIDEYNNASEEVKNVVKEHIRNVCDNETADNSYMYNEIDENKINSIIANAQSNLNNINFENNSIQQRIDAALADLELLNEEYANAHNGESYNYEINENMITPESTYMDEADKLYTKKCPIITISNSLPELIEDNAEVAINVTTDTTGELTFSNGSTIINNSAFTCTITSNDASNFVLTIKNNANDPDTSAIEAEYIKFNFVPSDTENFGTVSNFVVNENEIILNHAQSYYFYIGMNENNSVLSSNYELNVDSQELETYTSIDELLGEHLFNQASYIILPEEWYNQVIIKNEMQMLIKKETISSVSRIKVDNINYKQLVV